VTWRRTSLLLLGLSVALWSWIYLRDLGAYQPSNSEGARAQLDAERLLTLISTPSRCSGDCASRVLDRAGPHRWRVSLTTPSGQRCFVIDTDRFRYTDERGMTGLWSVGCA
jgi:hypothetical protein